MKQTHDSLLLRVSCLRTHTAKEPKSSNCTNFHVVSIKGTKISSLGTPHPYVSF